MSDFAAKNYGGLMEAYASIYKQPDQVIEEQVDQEVYFENVEVDSDLMVDIIIDRLVAEGYANTEDEALNIIPHMSDAWLDNVVGNFVLEQNFIIGVNTLLDEGYDLSSHTVDELYENYIFNIVCENELEDLHEALPLLAAPLLANPATWAAGAGLAAGAAYAGKKALDAYRQMRTGTDAASQRWLQTGSYASTKDKPTQKPAQDQRRIQQAKQRVLQRQQQQPAAQQPTSSKPQQLKPPTPTPKQKPEPSKPPTPSGGGGTQPPGGPPKGPNWKDILLGKTKAGLATRVGVPVAADLAGTAYDPSKYSASIGLAGLAPGALSLPLQGAAGLERFGKGFRQGAPLLGKGAYEQGQRTGIGQASRGTGETLGKISKDMLTQPWRKPSTPSTPSAPSTQPTTPPPSRVKW